MKGLKDLEGPRKHWVWVWVGLRPIDLIISKGCSMAPNPSESALLASLQAGLVHWKTFSTAANTQPEQALHDWFAKDAIATAGLRKCTLCAASSATIFPFVQYSDTGTMTQSLKIKTCHQKRPTQMNKHIWIYKSSV